MKKIRVCHFTSVHPAGDTRILVKECRSLARAGYEVLLVAPQDGDEERDGVRILGVPAPSGRLRRMIRGARSAYLKALETDADIYHFHDPELLRFARRLRKKGKVVIYDSHEDLPRQIAHKHYIPSWLRGLVGALAEWAENRWARQCTAIVAATPVIRDRFLRIHPACVDVCNYPSLEELGPPVAGGQKERAACYIGSITEARGIRETLEMMDGASFRLLLGGTFAPAQLKEEMEALPGWKDITYLGPLSREAVRHVLAQSRIGLVTLRNSPNYADALPVKMFEYMAAGIPVVTNRIPLWESIVNRHACGISVDIHDAAGTRAAIAALLDDPARCEEMGRNGRRAVETLYHWKQEEKKLLDLYAHLSGKR